MKLLEQRGKTFSAAANFSTMNFNLKTPFFSKSKQAPALFSIIFENTWHQNQQL